MARYDRISPLPPPARDDAFPAWLALRDIEGHERDGERARRVRLRFLALRPLRRLLAHGIERVPESSYQRQIEGVREELGHLSARDPERARLARYLHEISNRAPAALAAAALDIGEMTEHAGHRHAAEEFYRTACELAEMLALPLEGAAALRHLGGLYEGAAEPGEAEAYYQRAAEAALGAGDRQEWTRAIVGAAGVARRQARPAEARALLDDALRRGRDWNDPAVQAIAVAAIADLDLEAGDPNTALERAWAAAQHAPTVAERVAAYERVGRSLRRLGLDAGAEHAYRLILAEPFDGAARWRAEAELAVLAAEAGRATEFLGARERLLRHAEVEPPAPRALAALHLRLGWGGILAGALDGAREHLRSGLTAARELADADLLAEAEELLTVLEQAGSGEALPAQPVVPPTDRARQILGVLEARALLVATAS